MTSVDHKTHKKDLQILFTRLAEYGIIIGPEKCQFGTTELGFLGHHICSECISSFGTPATITMDRGAQFKSKLWNNLCNQFRIVRNRTTSYHPQSSGMVERFHRQLKAAIMAHESPSPWTMTLPAVLLGLRFAVKVLLGRSAVEMIYSRTLRLSCTLTLMG